MECPNDLKYTQEHEWIRIDEETKTAVIGITDFAQESLGDIVHVELPAEGDKVSKQDPFGSVESVKAVSDLFAPMSGGVVEINDALRDSPEILNEDCYGEAWLIRVKYANLSDVDDLMDSNSYQAFLEAQDEGEEA